MHLWGGPDVPLHRSCTQLLFACWDDKDCVEKKCICEMEEQIWRTRCRCHLYVNIKDFLYAADSLFKMKNSARLEIRFHSFVKIWYLTEFDLFTSSFVQIQCSLLHQPLNHYIICNLHSWSVGISYVLFFWGFCAVWILFILSYISAIWLFLMYNLSDNSFTC